jgi:hypothetical protein
LGKLASIIVCFGVTDKVPVQGTLRCALANANIFLANHGGNARNGGGRWFFITRFLAMTLFSAANICPRQALLAEAQSAIQFLSAGAVWQTLTETTADRGIRSEQSYRHLQYEKEAVKS